MYNFAMSTNKIRRIWEERFVQDTNPVGKRGLSYLAFTEIIHFASAVILFLLFFKPYGVLSASLSFFGAFLIDSDHMVDYLVFVFKGEKSLSLQKFFQADFFKDTKKIFIPLHSWELCFLLILGHYVFLTPAFLILGISMFVHLVTDQITNNVRVGTYFLSWRVLKGFDKNVVCKK